MTNLLFSTIIFKHRQKRTKFPRQYYASAGPKSKTPVWLEQIIIALITNPYAYYISKSLKKWICQTRYTDVQLVYRKNGKGQAGKKKLTPFRALASDRVVDNITKLARMRRNPWHIHDVKNGGTRGPLQVLWRIQRNHIVETNSPSSNFSPAL